MGMREALLVFPWRLKARWVFLRYVEVAFEREASAGDRAFVEEPADEGNAVRDSARWVEFWERFGWIRSPVAAGFGDFNETGAQG